MLNLPWEEPPVQVRLAAVKWVQQDTVGVEFSKPADDRAFSGCLFASFAPNTRQVVLRDTRIWRVACG